MLVGDGEEEACGGFLLINLKIHPEPYADADPRSWEASEHNTLDRFGICMSHIEHTEVNILLDARGTLDTTKARLWFIMAGCPVIGWLYVRYQRQTFEQR